MERWPVSWGPAPRFATPRTKGRATFGPVVGRTSEALGRPFYRWQQYVQEVVGEVMPDGSWAYDDITIVVQRRAGKNAMVNAQIVQRCTMARARPVSVWMTGQKRDKAVERWNDVRLDLIRSEDEVVRALAGSKISHGFEVLRFTDGSTFKPFAPDDESMHGEQPELVLIDELWALSLRDKKLMQAGYRPSWAFESGQEVKFSAGGIAGKSGWLDADRAAGRAVVEQQLEDVSARRGRAYFEWSIDEERGRELAAYAAQSPAALDELLSLMVEAHPRPGLRVAYLRDEFGRDPANFLRAYGGVDDLDGGEDTVVPLPVWTRAAWNGPSMTPEGARFGFGVAVDPDGLEAAIFAACRLPDGTGLVSVVEVAPGTRWAVGRVVQIVEDWPDADAVAIGNVGAERDMADQLAGALPEGRVLRLSVADDKAALSRFVKGVQEGPSVRHDASEELLGALRSARVSRGLWDRKLGRRDPFSALPAAHRAVWAADHLPEPKAKRVPFKIF